VHRITGRVLREIGNGFGSMHFTNVLLCVRWGRGGGERKMASKRDGARIVVAGGEWIERDERLCPLGPAFSRTRKIIPGGTSRRREEDLPIAMRSLIAAKLRRITEITR
jgi:hypothetical protein